MKPTHLIAFLALAATSLSTAAATDRSYYVTELATQQKFDVYNDGRNTYLESIPGLIVTGATADGERYIVSGVPPQIRGFMNGKPITVVRGIAPAPKAPPPPPSRPDSAGVNAELKRLTEELASLSKVASQQSSALGVPGTSTTPKSPVVVPSPAVIAPAVVAKVEQTWEVRITDGTVYAVLKRWSKAAGMQLMWETENHDLRIGANATYLGSFDASVLKLMESLKNSAYPLRACIYDDNGAVRILHAKKSCKG